MIGAEEKHRSRCTVVHGSPSEDICCHLLSLFILNRSTTALVRTELTDGSALVIAQLRLRVMYQAAMQWTFPYVKSSCNDKQNGNSITNKSLK